MKAKLILFIVLILNFDISAQIRYEDLDKYSQDISTIQSSSNTGDYHSSSLSFPEENFKVFFSTKLASYAYYAKKDGEDEVLKLYENVDFSKATSVNYSDWEEDASYVRVSFPGNYLQAKLIKESIETLATKGDKYLDFFYKRAEPMDRATLFKYLTDLILMMKVDKNVMQSDEVDRLKYAWGSTVLKNTTTGFKSFLQKYPKSVYSAFAQEYATQAYGEKPNEAMAELEHGRVVSYIIDSTWGHAEGLMCVKFNKKSGFADQNYKIIIPLIYDEVQNFKNGLAKVKLKEKWFTINRFGRKVSD